MSNHLDFNNPINLPGPQRFRPPANNPSISSLSSRQPPNWGAITGDLSRNIYPQGPASGRMRPEAAGLENYILQSIYGNQGVTPEERTNLITQRDETVRSGTSDINSWLRDALGVVKRNALSRGMDQSSTELYGQGRAVSEGVRGVGQLTSQANSDFVNALNSLPFEKRKQMIQLLEVMMSQKGQGKKRPWYQQLIPAAVGAAANIYAPGSGAFVAGLTNSIQTRND